MSAESRNAFSESSRSGGTGFLSYAHLDDEAEGGRITQLARDVVGQYEMLTGEAIELFIDQDAIEWGTKWRQKIDDSLASVRFFIPIMTPRYFMRKECTRELEYFAERAKQLGITKLILPLHYVEVPELTDDSEKDGVLGMLSEYQYRDWRNLRFSDRASEPYRREVSAIAKYLVEANVTADQAVPEMDIAEKNGKEKGDDAPGALDLLAGSERALPELVTTVSELTEQTSIIREIMHESQRRVSATTNFRNRILEVRNVAMKLRAPTTNIDGLGKLYKSLLQEIDDGLRVIIAQAPEEIERDPEAKKQFCDLFTQIVELSVNSAKANEGMKTMIKGCHSLEQISRDIRPVIRRLRGALTVIVGEGKTTAKWKELIESSGVDC